MATVANHSLSPGEETESRYLTMFKDIVSTSRSPHQLKAKKQPPSFRESDIYTKIASLDTKVKDFSCDSNVDSKDAKLGQIFHTVLHDVLPAIRRSHGHSGRLLKELLVPVLQYAVSRKTSCSFQSLEYANLPSASQICLIYAEVGLNRAVTAMSLITKLLEDLTQTSAKAEESMSIHDYKSMLFLRETLIRDLLDTWAIVCYPLEALEVLHQQPQPEWPPTKLSLPHYDDDALKDATIDKIEAEFRKLFFAGSTEWESIKLAAVATYILLKDHDRTNRDLRFAAREFLGPLSLILTRACALKRGYLRSACASNPTLRDYVVSRQHYIRPHSVPNPSPAPRNSDEVLKVDVPSRHSSVHRALSMALRSRDAQDASRIWQEFKDAHEAKSTPKPGEPTQGREIMSQTLDFFLHIFTALQESDRTLEVWNFMDSKHIRPTINTWTSMIHGCKIMKNPRAIENLWGKLLKSGIHPDNHAWTARISGLASCGDLPRAYQALDEMVEAWQAGASGNVKPVPLSIEVVNALLVTLARGGNIKDVNKLLEWSESYGVKGDTYTYNILLGVAVKRRDQDAIDGLLTAMQSAGIEPDKSTFTVLIENTLYMINEKEQAKFVSDILKAMDHAKMSANMETYGKLIHALLDTPQNSEKSVKVVLQHLWARGYSLSSHIMTTLVDYYFAQRPPNIDAVKFLTQNRLAKGLSERVDRVFWERVIKGYAEVGLTTEAMDAFERLSKAPPGPLDTPISLAVATIFLDRLLSQGEIIRAKRVVSVLAVWGTSKASEQLVERERFFKHKFWHTASRSGLLHGLTVPLPN